MGSSLRREGIVAMAVPGPNLPVAPMDHKLRPLVLGDFATAMDCVGFSVEGFSRALSARAPDGPSILVWDDVLVAFGVHVRLLLQHNCCLTTYAEENPGPDISLIVSGFGRYSAYTTTKRSQG